MSLINCAECQREVSDKATSCPHCGAPIATVAPSPPISPRSSGTLREAQAEDIAGRVAVSRRADRRGHMVPPVGILRRALRSVPRGEPSTHACRSHLPRVAHGARTCSRYEKHVGSSTVCSRRAKNPTTKQERTYRVDLAPRGTREIGWGEGWVVSSGDTVTLSHNEYKSHSARIP